ncbi:hypothetical protein CRENBAI_019327 [Crenichthys baileyi]|uniref:NADH dehydrogenase subunit 6 n=1 Tax=Crenichthys baileyi TaxID=28760 RepID=A0AAV9QQ06_9TELE
MFYFLVNCSVYVKCLYYYVGFPPCVSLCSCSFTLLPQLIALSCSSSPPDYPHLLDLHFSSLSPSIYAVWYTLFLASFSCLLACYMAVVLPHGPLFSSVSIALPSSYFIIKDLYFALTLFCFWVLHQTH